MFHILLAGIVARAGLQTSSIPSPRGHEKLTVHVPSGFHEAPGLRGRLLFLNGPVQLSVTWSANRVSPPFLKAIQKNTEQLSKKGQVAGQVSIGHFSGPLLVIPIKPKGLSVHAALIYNRDMLSFSYFNPNLGGTSPNSVVATVKNMIASARLTGT